MDTNVLLHGDCLEVLKSLPDNSVDSIVTDPPAGIEFLGKDWDSFKQGRLANYAGPPGGNVKPLGESRGWQATLPKISQSANRKCLSCGQYKFSRTPCVCKVPDWEPDSSVRDTFVAFMTAVFTEALRVLKPGGHAVIWAIPRTSHWTAWAVENSGFEIRDAVYHAFATGFPKNHDVSKAIAEMDPALAKRWEGWGTALKPAVEVWWLARKPLAQTVAKSVVEFGTGALNIDGCRVGEHQNTTPGGMSRYNAANAAQGYRPSDYFSEDPMPSAHAPGRWPTNFVMTHAPDCEVGHCVEGCPLATLNKQAGRNVAEEQLPSFYFVPKPGRSEKEQGLDDLPVKIIGTLGGGGEDANDPVSKRFTKFARNTHPTPKPTTLMQHLVRLVTPPGGIVLDPFAGSGTTCLAAIEESMQFIGIEREDEYINIARARIKAVREAKEASEHQRDLFALAMEES